MSITLKATLHGHEVMVTLRGVDFASVKAQVEQAASGSGAGSSTATHAGHRAPSGRCSKHGGRDAEPKEGRYWWSHKTAEGSWCKGK